MLARPGWQLPAGALPINAVRLESQFNGETADVKVTLLRGVDGFEREDLVGNYHVGLSEEKIVPELKSFGIEPFKITLSDVVPSLPPSPAFENRTSAIEIVSVRSENVPLPTYVLTLRNLSEKKIRALRIDVTSDGRPGISSLRQGEHDRALIEPGAVVEERFQVVRAQKTPTAYTRGAAASNVIVIRTAIFDDLSFEGDQAPACDYESYVVGRRLWLTRVLPFIDRQLANNALSPEEFKERFLELSYELEEGEKTNRSSVSATCPNPDLMVKVSTQNLKLQLLRDLDRIIKTRPAPPINFKAWLESTGNDYKAWLARL